MSRAQVKLEKKGKLKPDEEKLLNSQLNALQSIMAHLKVAKIDMTRSFTGKGGRVSITFQDE